MPTELDALKGWQTPQTSVSLLDSVAGASSPGSSVSVWADPNVGMWPELKAGCCHPLVYGRENGVEGGGGGSRQSIFLAGVGLKGNKTYFKWSPVWNRELKDPAQLT